MNDLFRKLVVCGIMTFFCQSYGTNPFLETNADKVVDFAKKIKNGEIEKQEMLNPFEELDVSLSSSSSSSSVLNEELIVRNLELAAYYVPNRMTDFQSKYSSAIIKIANKAVSGGEGVNYKILDLLFRSQFQENKSTGNFQLKSDVRTEIIETMIERFEALVNGDKRAAKSMEDKFYGILSKDSRFAIYCCGRDN